MNISIVNAWSDDNKGDAAIVEGLIRSLSAEASEAPVFTLISMFRESEGLADHYRHTLRLAENLSICPALLAVDPPPSGPRSLRRLQEFARASLLLLLGGWGRLFLTPGERRTLTALEQSDLVISKGGHIYFSRGTLKSILGLFRNLFPVLLAQRLGRPTVVFGQSIGPVQGRVQRWMVGRALARLDGIYVREPVSSLQVKELVSDAVPILCWDSAFAVVGESLPPEVMQVLPDHFVGLTVRQWGFPYDRGQSVDSYEQYLAGLACCIERLRHDREISVVVIPQAVGPTPMENDLTAAALLRERIDVVQLGTIFLDDDLTAGQLLTLYGRAEFVLATRFHSAILAMKAGSPTVAISYHGPKAPGIMELMGLKSYVLDISEASPGSLWPLCCSVLENREELTAALKGRRVEIMKAMGSSVRNVLRSGA